PRWSPPGGTRFLAAWRLRPQSLMYGKRARQEAGMDETVGMIERVAAPAGGPRRMSGMGDRVVAGGFVVFSAIRGRTTAGGVAADGRGQARPALASRQ